jgi:hypothetical protein
LFGLPSSARQPRPPKKVSLEGSGWFTAWTACRGAPA